jgi:Domain of unknown function (DUF6458)
MGIGVSVFLIALGLILALAVNVHVPGIDLHMVGWILTLVGVVGLVWTVVLWNRARSAVGVRVVREADTLEGRPGVREERIIREDPPGY